MASACPKSNTKNKKVAPTTPGTYTVNPPAVRNRACNATSSEVIKDGPSTSITTTTNSTPAQNPPLPCVLGFKFEGEWESLREYKKQTCFSNPNGSVVTFDGASWLCIQDHTSGEGLQPSLEAPIPPAVNGQTYWEPLAKSGKDKDAATTDADSNKSWWDKITDWVKDADIWDWLKVAAIAGGLIYLGYKLLNSMDDDGSGDGNADKRYNGSAGYHGTYDKPTLRNVLIKLCEYGSITANVDLIDPSEVVEFTLASTTSVRTVLQQLSIAFNFDMVDTGGVLKFVPRKGDPIGEISLGDMGFSANNTPPAPFTSKRFQGISLPRKVNITYFSPKLDMNNYTQTAELFTYPEGNEITVNVPITLTDIQARRVAELNLINAHLERMNYKFTTSYKFLYVEAGDILNSPMGVIRITKINETDSGLLAFEACDAGEPSASVLSNLEYSVPEDTGNTDATLGYSQAFFIDPPWTSTSDTGIRLYAVVHGYARENWPGAQMYISRDGGNNYNPFMTIQNETTWGVAQGILAAPVIATSGADKDWDVTNTLSVKLKLGELTSATDAEVLAGKNWIYIGQELIAFGVATLTADKTYTLSRLKRGLQGTDQFGNKHQADELVADFNSLVRVPLEESDFNKTLYFKTVTFGSGLDVADLDEVYVSSNNTKLWAPNSGTAVRQIDNSWLISWKETLRTPDVVNNQSSNLVQVDEEQTGWGVAITDSLGNVVSTRPCGFTNFTYTADEQVNDFGIAQTQLYASVVPMHKKYGGGYPLKITS